MATRVDFTNEEWITLRAVLNSILVNMSIADNQVDCEEARAWRREINEQIESSTLFMRELLSLEGDKCEDSAVVDKASQNSLEELLEEARDILKAKASVEEITDYKKSLVGLAVAVAEGAFGGDTEENAVLATINDKLAQW